MTSTKRVIKPRTVAEQLLYSTVKISSDGGTGTGFFFNIKLENGNNIPLILTNKHVINNATKLSFYFHEAILSNQTMEPLNKSFSINIEYNESIWVSHPREDVDLGALLFNPISDYAKNNLKKLIYNIFFDDSLILSDDALAEETDVANTVLMIGYPIGLWDEYNNFPIVRKGITASHPALDYNGKSVGIIDMACFPGSSGSPILISMSGFNDKLGNYNFANKNILLGLLFSGPYHTQHGKIEAKEVPMSIVPMATYNQMIHLGYYVKAKEILILCDAVKDRVLRSQS